jgi:2,4-dienoyl-CoA reductase-like NADH-dependent reductase (Old Yellow Enzyme family)
MRLNEPLEIRGTALSNRLAAAPMASFSFDGDGMPTERAVKLYESFAASGAGMVVVEHHAVHPWGRNRFSQPRLYDDRHAEALRAIVAPFKKNGVPILAQVNFAGSMTADEGLLRLDDFEYVSPSGVKTPRDSLAETPRALEPGQIAEIVEAFASAAVRAVELAGYDGVQIHCAHGYLLGQFLSPLTNRRDDAYGGSDKKRARLLYEITDAVRGEIRGKILSVRLGMSDYMPGTERRGLSVDETAPVARELAAIGADWIGLSGNHCGFGVGIEGDNPYFAPFARVIHDALGGAALCDYAGGVRSARTADELLADGVCDIVSVGRPFLSDPNFPKAWLK